MYECRYYQMRDDGVALCQLCPHRCHIFPGKTGLCRSRRNVDGRLVSEVYGRPCAIAVDPIEKKPLYHFHPGTTCLSIACTGCNFRCLNCQNHDISQASPSEVRHIDLNPEQVIDPEIMDSIDEEMYQEAQKNYEEEMKAAQARAEQERKQQASEEKKDQQKDKKKDQDKKSDKDKEKDKKKN